MYIKLQTGHPSISKNFGKERQLTTMSKFHLIYLVIWGLNVVITLILSGVKRNSIVLFSREYQKFLFIPWKIFTFLVAFVGLNAVGPFTGDPTWDFATASFMSVLTYLTAPWVVGILYRVIFKQEYLWQAYIAVCLWMFSASWSYDLYLLIRDGYYPVTWSANLFASSILYLCAGLFWNLSFKSGRGVHFAFTEVEWPEGEKLQSFKIIFLYALPFMLLVSAMILYFLIPDSWF